MKSAGLADPAGFGDARGLLPAADLRGAGDERGELLQGVETFPRPVV